MKLLPQQFKAKSHLQYWKVGALFMEAGTGKTRVACELIQSVDDIDMILWIGPLNTIRLGKESVVSEIAKWVTFNNIHFVGVESIQQSDRIYIETLNLIEKAKKPFVVVDESIKIKNMNAKRTKRVLEIGARAEYKLILNGTPFTRNVLDVYAQMQFLSPKILNMTENRFKNTFCKYTTITKKVGFTSYSKEYITGYANIDYLYSLLRSYIYECDLNLNIKQNYDATYYSLLEDSLELYNNIKERYLSLDAMEFFNNNIFIQMTQELQHSYCCAAEKFEIVDDIFKREKQGNTIIFCKFIKSQEECKKRYPNAKILSLQKDSMGLNLQEYNTTIYFDKVWDYALREQSARRTYRTGQVGDCGYYDLTARNIGLDKLIDHNISKKINMTEYFKRISKEQFFKEV